MKAFDPQVYDALPTILQNINNAARQLAMLPLEASLQVCDRIEAAGCYTSAAGTTPIPPDLAAQQRRLVEIAMAFRDGCVAVLTGAEQ